MGQACRLWQEREAGGRDSGASGHDIRNREISKIAEYSNNRAQYCPNNVSSLRPVMLWNTGIECQPIPPPGQLNYYTKI